MATNLCDVIVIGGGLGGLAAAAYLARGGRRVAILERSKRIGGRATTRQEQGFHLNLGAHALYRCGPAEAALAELGVESIEVGLLVGAGLAITRRQQAQ